MKKNVIILILIMCFTLIACKEKEEENKENKEVSQFVLDEERACFNFFWENQNITQDSKGLGLIPDRYPSNGLASIASVGFGLAAIVIGVENKWITYEEGKTRAVQSLSSLDNLETKEGFYYHFYYEKTGIPANGSEISNIDTAIFLCGAMLLGEYFKEEVQTLANKIYDEVNWNWFVNPKTNHFYMAYNPKTDISSGAWDYYAEQLIMYFLAAGSNTHPIEKKVYDSFKRAVGKYKGDNFIYSWYGSIFTYQFSHAFIDFRNIVDEKGTNWFTNSVNATLANYQYCIDNSNTFQTFSEVSWGLTACDSKNGYNGFFGSFPSGYDISKKIDGTVAPAGAIGSIVFTPDIVIPTINNYATLLNGKLIGKYGFKDAFNFEGQNIWIANDVIGIDKGISLLMIENYRSQLIWKYFMKCDFMGKAIMNLGFLECDCYEQEL